jgi:hypothetical protein
LEFRKQFGKIIELRHQKCHTTEIATINVDSRQLLNDREEWKQYVFTALGLKGLQKPRKKKKKKSSAVLHNHLTVLLEKGKL